MKHPGVYKTIVVVTLSDLSTVTGTYSGELPEHEAAMRVMYEMTLGRVKEIEDIFVTYVKDMTKLQKPVLGWGS